MDLTREFPRSPRERMAGLVHIPRMADKARAARQNQLGEYIFPCPLDVILLEFLGADAEIFQEMACEGTDETLAAWVDSKSQNRSQEEKEQANRRIIESRPDDPEKVKKFQEIRDRLDPSRTGVSTWVDLIDLEEGRL